MTLALQQSILFLIAVYIITSSCCQKLNYVEWKHIRNIIILSITYISLYKSITHSPSAAYGINYITFYDPYPSRLNRLTCWSKGKSWSSIFSWNQPLRILLSYTVAWPPESVVKAYLSRSRMVKGHARS